jgi:hypothetical protein
VSTELVGKDVGKEPGGWELYRGIERVEAAIHEMTKNSVSAAVFAVEKQALHTRIDGQATEIAQLRADALLDRKQITDYQKEQDSQKGRNRLFVYGIIGAALAPQIVEALIRSLAA